MLEFKQLDYIEQWGSGMNRIHELCQLAGNPQPTISESGDFIDIEFHRPEVVEGGQIGGQESGQILELTERQHEVLRLLKDNPSITRKALVDSLNINASAVQKHLEKLKEAGAIERIGGTRGYWKVKT